MTDAPLPSIPSLDLTGKVAVITGAARGIGQAAAELLSACGAAVAICDRRESELDTFAARLADGGATVWHVAMDVREPALVAAFASNVRERFGVVDVLVNNAGGSFHAPFTEVSAKGEQMLIAENFTSVTQLVRLFVPLMAGGASIVNVTSVEAHQAAPGFAVYAAMKAGLASLTKSLALELSERGIRVNAIAPDAIVTQGDAVAREEMLAAEWRYEPVVQPPLGRVGSPAEAARVVLFLVSELSSFVTGTTIHVDGGTAAAGGWRLR